MPRDASELAHRLAREAEAVCRHYLSNGRREGRYWLVGDVRNTPGRSMFVRLKGPESGRGAAGKWTDAATGEHGDLLDVIRESCGLLDFHDVADEARRFLRLPRSDPEPSPKTVRIGRRLTEELESKHRRHRLLLMLDEFPALGRLDFFESALAFMAGYGLKSFLIAQSLNQIEKAYGQNNSILDTCHVRVSFATNDERTAKRVSDALGMATELRAMKNYAGSRLSPWLGHLMISRQETARPLLTPGEVMQLPPDNELVLVSGCAPIRAKKARYFEDPELQARILQPPTLSNPRPTRSDETPSLAPDGDWAGSVVPPPAASATEDPANAGIRREPELPEHEEIVPESKAPVQEFEPMDEEPDDEVQRQRIMQRSFGAVARQVSLGPGDDMQM